jgi:hypothetical protein
MDAWGMLTLPDMADPQVSSQCLADLLRRGQLALLLGAGVSADVGLPSWNALVAGCESAVGITPINDRPAEELMRAIDTVRRRLDKLNDGRTMIDLVRAHLYDADDLARGQYSSDIMRVPLLIALGAIVMASSRGSVGDVFTLNFDDLLEWYLHLHGFKTQVVTEVPTYLRGDVDVTVFHPHGFIPLVQDLHTATDWLVLSHQQLIKRLSASSVEEPWTVLLESRFLTKRFLAVGTSMQDIDISIHLQRALTAHGRGPLGFVLGVDIPDDRRDLLLECGMVPVNFTRYDEIPRYLLGVCQRAALDQ